MRSNNDLHDVHNEVNQRANKDSVVNNYGRMLTQMCIIVNGRCVDHAIVSKSLLCAVSEIKVLEFHELLSDIHLSIELDISFTCSPYDRFGDMDISKNILPNINGTMITKIISLKI